MLCLCRSEFAQSYLSCQPPREGDFALRAGWAESVLLPRAWTLEKEILVPFWARILGRWMRSVGFRRYSGCIGWEPSYLEVPGSEGETRDEYYYYYYFIYLLIFIFYYFFIIIFFITFACVVQRKY